MRLSLEGFVLCLLIREGKIPKALKVRLHLFLENLGDYCEREQAILIHHININVVSLLPRNEYLRAFALFAMFRYKK